MYVNSYQSVLVYDGAAIARGRRGELVPCAVQPRDVDVIDAVRRWRFLTAPQIMEVWWPGGVPQVGRRRLTKLFEAGYLDRFRPVARRGSFPWTYQLGREGHRLLQRTGLLDVNERHERVEIYDYRYILHAIHLVSWVIGWRRLLGDLLLAWEGETQVDVPREPRSSLPSADAPRPEALVDARWRPVRPDAVLEVEGRDRTRPHTFFVEYDRTRRVDKNFEKFRRYDCFASSWWRDSTYGAGDRPPWIVFVCQDARQRELFLQGAHRQVMARVVDDQGRVRWPGRERMLFVDENDMHEGRAIAYALRPDPRTGSEAQGPVIRLPGSRAEDAQPVPAMDDAVQAVAG